jgi:hypothetical protein
LSWIDSWVEHRNNGKNQGGQIPINKISSDEIKKMNDKKIAIKKIRTSLEKKIERIN